MSSSSSFPFLIITTEAPSRVETPAVASSSPAAVVAALTPDRRKKTASSPAAARLSPPVARRPRPEYLLPSRRHPPVSSFSPESAGLPPRPRSPLRLSVKQTRGLVARLLLLYCHRRLSSSSSRRKRREVSETPPNPPGRDSCVDRTLKIDRRFACRPRWSLGPGS